MTLDTYADLFDEDLDDVAGALGRARQDVYVVAETGTQHAQISIEATEAKPAIVWVVTVGPIPVAVCASRAGADTWVRDAQDADHEGQPTAYRVWELSITPDAPSTTTTPGV
ncbi:hypothetical protein AB1K54_15295 [Microbacterium sp. BWT-B31]|uniref:hypothetical protein n=1 Tax=Microbacterium sp. BWT-B31 TaxID=3232072 RepID=UPI00352863B8